MDHIIIEAVTPRVDCGRYPARHVVGDWCVVEADIFRDGHDIIRAAVKWRHKADRHFAEAPMAIVDNDRWRGEFPLEDNTRYVFTIEGWTDVFGSWQSDFAKKVRAGRDVASDRLEGVKLVESAYGRAREDDRAALSR